MEDKCLSVKKGVCCNYTVAFECNTKGFVTACIKCLFKSDILSEKIQYNICFRENNNGRNEWAYK